MTMTTLARRTLRVVALAALGIGLAMPAQAGTATLRRSIQNIVFAPFDLVLSPVVGVQSVRKGLRDEDDSRGVVIAYTVPGVFWQTGVQAGTSVLREVAGLLELLPGIFLLPFETELDPIFDLPEQREALLDYEIPAFRVRAGVDYVSPGGF